MKLGDVPIAAILDRTNHDVETHNSQHYHSSIGLTKREYFAALAMQAIISRPDLQFRTQFDREACCFFAKHYADRLIYELNMENEGAE